MLSSAKNTLNTNVCRDIEENYGEITMEKLITLNRQMKKGLSEHRRAEARWESLLEKAFLMEDILVSRQSKEKKIRSTFWIEKTGPINEMVEVIRKKKNEILKISNVFIKLVWYWHVKIKKIVFMVLSVFFGIFSLIVILSEVTLFLQVDLSVFGNLIRVCQGFVETEVKKLI